MDPQIVVAEELISLFHADESNEYLALNKHLPILIIYMDHIREQGDGFNLIDVTNHALPHFMQVLIGNADQMGMGDMFPWTVREEVVRNILMGTEEGIDWHIKMLIMELDLYLKDKHFKYILRDTPYEPFAQNIHREWLATWMDENY
jgi:hypothetical protein